MEVIDYVTRVVITLAALVYPGYQSYKTVKKSDVPGQQSWLKYWLVLSVTAAIMLIVEPLLYNRLPLYPIWKIGGVLFLVLPKFRGYEKIYQSVLQPQLDRHEATIDATAEKVFKVGQEHANNVKPQLDRLVKKGRDFAQKTLNKKTT